MAALAVGAPACQDNVDAPDMVNPVADVQPNMTILELKERFWSEATNYAMTIENENDPTERFIIHGYVSSSDEEGNVFKSLVIQDETAALAFSIDQYNLYMNYRIGQEIILDVTGMEIGKYAGLQQIGRKSWYENGNTWQVSFMSNNYFKQYAQLNGLPAAANVDTIVMPNFDAFSQQTPEVLRKYQSQLVRLQNVSFPEGGKRTFSVYHTSENDEQNNTLNDRNGNTLTVRTSGYCTFFNDVLPEGTIDLVGILSYYNSAWQLIMIDGNGIYYPGEQPGSKEKPYSVEQAIKEQKDGNKAEGWVKGYIVGAVAPLVEDVNSNSDIEWTAPTVLANTLVIAPSATTTNYDECLVVLLPAGSQFQSVANLRDNPSLIGKEILVKGTLSEAVGTYGIIDNGGTAEDFEIEGVVISDGSISDGTGAKETPYNVTQLIAKNPTSKDVPVESDIWVKGYILGYMPSTPSTALQYTVWGTEGAVETNIVLGPTPDCQDYTKCIGIQISKDIRSGLSLASKPGNLGAVATIKGNIIKYCGAPGLGAASEFSLEGASDEPVVPPVTGEAVEGLNESFATIPATWTNIKVSGDKAWYATSFNDEPYAAMTGYKGTQPPYDSWLISPAVDMDKAAEKILTFRNQVNGYSSTTTVFEAYVLTSNDPTTATKTALSFNKAVAPASGYSGFVESGNVDLSGFTGKIYIGFRYYATTDANYATWCVTDVKLNASAVGGGDTPDPTPDPDPVDPSGECISIPYSSLNVTDDGVTNINGYTITISKAAGATAPAIGSYSQLRLYAKNTVTIAGPTMARVVFDIDAAATNMQNRYTDLIPSTGKMDTQAAGDTEATWNGNAADVTFTVGALATYGAESTKPGQVFVKAIKIYPAE